MIFGTENQTKSENPQKHAQSLAHLLYFTETTAAIYEDWPDDF